MEEYDVANHAAPRQKVLGAAHPWYDRQDRTVAVDIDDDVSEAWRFTRKAIDRVLDEYARQVARGFSRSFGAGAAAILNFELSLQLRSEVDRVRKDAMERCMRS